jgi:hypothetical protein
MTLCLHTERVDFQQGERTCRAPVTPHGDAVVNGHHGINQIVGQREEGTILIPVSRMLNSTGKHMPDAQMYINTAKGALAGAADVEGWGTEILTCES